MWMLLTYTIVLIFATDLTHFFMDPINFTQDFDKVLTCFATVYIFKLIEPSIHSSTIECLGNNILT